MKHKIYFKILNLLPKKIGRSLLYKHYIKKKLDIKNPKDFNEKINWLIIYKYGKKESKLADKNEVKTIIGNLQIDDLCIPKTIALYKKGNDINISDLPDSFVIKTNNGCGNVEICNDKKNINEKELKMKFNKYIKKDFSKETLEYHYSNIKPIIIVEEYLKEFKHKNPLDYKIYCFNGKADSILVCSNREKKLRLNHFDLNWNEVNIVKDDFRGNKKINKPENLDKMIRISEEICKKLSLDFARVDLYNLNGKIYFGELTFTPANGIINYYTKEGLLKLGKLIKVRR